MSQALWSARPAPLRACAAPIGWTGTPGSAAELSLLRLRLRNALLAAAAWVDEDALERLLLVFEELASNGLRHGRGAVQVVVRAASGGGVVGGGGGGGAGGCGRRATRPPTGRRCRRWAGTPPRGAWVSTWRPGCPRRTAGPPRPAARRCGRWCGTGRRPRRRPPA